MVLAIVAAAILGHHAQRLGPLPQVGQARVVLIADHPAEVLCLLHQVADHPLGLGDGVHVKDADPLQALMVGGLEIMAEELIEPADHQHGHILVGQIM